MKKKLFLFVVFLAGVFTSVDAQQNWGLRGGLNLSTLDMTQAIFVGGNDNQYKEGFLNWFCRECGKQEDVFYSTGIVFVNDRFEIQRYSE